MNTRDFNNISIRGRVAYAILCFENYVQARYTDKDFSVIASLMWSIVGDTGYIDENADKYMEAIPEYLYEFDNFEDSEFDYITKEEYESFKSILCPSDASLNTIMHRIYDIATEYAYEGFDAPGNETIQYICDVVDELRKNNVPVPEYKLVQPFSFDEYDGWGDFIQASGLSNII